MTLLCQFKDSLGIPGEGIHKLKFLGIAVWDLFFTVLGALAISKYFKYPFYIVFLVLFVLGEILHILFCVKTGFLKLFV